MSLTQHELEEQLAGVATALSVEQGEDGYLRGVLHHAAFMFKLISADPPVYFFKFRRNTSPFSKSTWAQNLPPVYAKADIACDVEADYVYLSIRDASGLSASEIVSLAEECVVAHAAYFPQAPHYCYACRKHTAMTWLVQSGTAIATICGPCLEKKSIAAQAAEQQRRGSEVGHTFLLPSALMISAAGWACVWWGYGRMLPEGSDVYVAVPRIAIFLVVALVGFTLGWPVGTLLKKSGATRRWPRLPVSVAAGIFSVVAGEALFALWAVYMVTGALDLDLALRNIWSLALGESLEYAILKAFFAVSLVVAIHQISAPKKNRLDL